MQEGREGNRAQTGSALGDPALARVVLVACVGVGPTLARLTPVDGAGVVGVGRAVDAGGGLNLRVRTFGCEVVLAGLMVIRFRDGSEGRALGSLVVAAPPPLGVPASPPPLPDCEPLCAAFLSAFARFVIDLTPNTMPTAPPATTRMTTNMITSPRGVRYQGFFGLCGFIVNISRWSAEVDEEE